MHRQNDKSSSPPAARGGQRLAMSPSVVGYEQHRALTAPPAPPPVGGQVTFADFDPVVPSSFVSPCKPDNTTLLSSHASSNQGRWAQRYVPTPSANAADFSTVTSRLDDSLTGVMASPDRVRPVERDGAHPVAQSTVARIVDLEDGNLAQDASVRSLHRRVAALEEERAEFKVYRQSIDAILSELRGEIDALKNAGSATDLTSAAGDINAVLVDVLRRERDAALRENSLLRERISKEQKERRLISPKFVANRRAVA